MKFVLSLFMIFSCFLLTAKPVQPDNYFLQNVIDEKPLAMMECEVKYKNKFWNIFQCTSLAAVAYGVFAWKYNILVFGISAIGIAGLLFIAGFFIADLIAWSLIQEEGGVMNIESYSFFVMKIFISVVIYEFMRSIAQILVQAFISAILGG